MKKTILILSLVASFDAFSQVSESLVKSLSPWSPISLKNANGDLIIVLDEHRITDTIYTAIINNGLCMPVWLGDKDTLANVKSVAVLNKFSKQGYLFEGGADTCVKLGEFSSDKQSEVYLMGQSKIY
ncbi:hypothetical protein [Grimontia sp. SpTr1]|uniref:hypothetical protein n=1 Tax=Grimontia sp. SpTr1 TaxID=2995319 RepID=UPI00248AEA28|nr:hypothetical protein [Grimontia sp. SpTr1]